MARGIWAGIWCVLFPPLGVWLALGLLERKPEEVPPEAPKSRRPIIIAPDGHAMCPCVLVEAKPDWSKMEAYEDDL